MKLLGAGALLLVAGVLFFGQRPLEARHRPWTGPHVTSDGWYYYHNLRSLILDGNLDLSNEYAQFGNWYGFGRTSTGAPENPFGIGPAVVWSPGFLVGHALAKLENDRTSEWRKPHGYSPYEQAGTLTLSFLAGIGTLVLTTVFLRHHDVARVAWPASLATAIGGPLVWYAIYEPAMPHALDAFFVSCFFVVALDHARNDESMRIRRAIMLGTLLGFAALMRPHNAVLSILYIEEFARRAWRCQRSAHLSLILRFALGLACGCIVFSPQLFAWKYIYGEWLVVPQGSEFMRWAEPLWSEVLFSSRNGLLTTTPLLWLSVIGLTLAVCRGQKTAVWLALFVLYQVYATAAAWDWWGGGAYGGRRLLGCQLPFAYGMAVCLDAMTRGRSLLRTSISYGLLGVGIAVQLLILHGYKTKMIGRDDPRPFFAKVEPVLGPLPALLAAEIGNPFAMPANLWFAVTRGVHPAKYDLAVGPYAMSERTPSTNPSRKLILSQHVELRGPTAAAWLGRGLEIAPEVTLVREPEIELYLPLNRPGDLHVDVSFVLPGNEPLQDLAVTIRGEALDITISGFARHRRIRFYLSDAQVRRGLNVLRVTGLPQGTSLTSMKLREGMLWPGLWREISARRHGRADVRSHPQ